MRIHSKTSLRNMLSFLCSFILSIYGNTQDVFGDSQKDPALVSVPTPGAASLGKFGQVPVDLYNGMYNLSIPIYSIPVKGQNIPIQLSYHSGGVKPNEKGGVVGVGWSLIASGSITRIQNGPLDEHINNAYNDSALGYYWNRSQMNVANWDSATAVQNFLQQLSCSSGCSGGNQWHDWAPDEFMFNFLGYSGSFWLDHTGAWMVRENSGEKFTVDVDFGEYAYKYPTAAQAVKVKWCFKKFTLKDGGGNTFVFGGDSSSVELNRNIGAYPLATATSWYLTQVITSKGEKINFNYQRLWPSASAFSSMTAYNSLFGSSPYWEWNLNALYGSLHDPVYLIAITYNNLNIQFQYSISNIASYCCNPLRPGQASDTLPADEIYTYIQSSGALTEPSNESVYPKPQDYKLDQITINYGSDQKQFRFAYYDPSSANRLFLKSVSEGPVIRPLVHQFFYNKTSFYMSSDPKWIIPDGLLTKKTDHWGYYNGVFPYKTSELPTVAGGYYTSGVSPGIAFLSNNFIDTYIASRQPNADSMMIGSLSRVVYPTGGYTDFIYEPHTYSSQLKMSDNTTQFLGANSTAGGLRIKKIVSYPDSLGSAPVIKQYRYVNDNGYSSGILNSAGILYTDSLSGSTGSITFTYKYFADNNQLPLQNTNGNNVTYTRVDEINSDSSKTTYRYYNYDNGHYDLMPTNFTSVMVNAGYYRKNNSRGFQRGKLFSQTQYDSVGTKVTQKNTDYINDDAITSAHTGVRSYAFDVKNIKMGSWYRKLPIVPIIFPYVSIWSPTVSPVVHYVHNYPVVRKTDTLFNGSSYIATKDTFIYNSSNNKISSHTISNLSNGTSKTEQFNYPNDYSGNTFYNGMITANVIDPVIKRTVTDNSGKTLSATKDSLKLNTVNSRNYYWLYERQQYQVASDITKSNVLVYDTVGNPVYVKGVDSIPTAYLWNYSSIYPVAIAKYADNLSIAYTSFEGENTGYWSVPSTTRNTSTSITGAQSFNLGTTAVTASVPVGKKYIVSYWAKSTVIVKSNGTTVSASLTGVTKNGWTYYEHLLPVTTTSVAVSSGSTSIIDELRLYPEKAQMTTYAYAPLDGVSAISGSNGMIVYYDYDAFSRLYKIRDMDNNILKLYDYQYNLLAKPVGNTLQIKQYRRSNCSSGCTGTLVNDTVPANTYYSYISQNDANQQAINYLDVHGPTKANAQGFCTSNVSCSRNVAGANWKAYYTSTSTGLVYTFTIPTSTGGGAMGTLPIGTYNVTISKTGGNSTSYTFSVGSLTMDGTSGSFSNVNMTCTAQTISINNVL